MNTNNANSPRAFSLIELGVVLAVIAFLMLFILPGLTGRAQKQKNCVNNLKQIALGFQMWSRDSVAAYPWGVAVSEWGTKEFAVTGSVVSSFQAISNVVGSPKIFACISDRERKTTTNWTSLGRSNISYFISLEARDVNPEGFLVGDRHLTVGGVPQTNSIVTVSSNQVLGWSAALHRGAGNVALCDGSVLSGSSADLNRQFHRSSLQTNRFVLP